jgi:uncharacterized zinc-type alcohol dehydrogenase-like protein
MTTTTAALSAPHAKAPLERIEITRRDLRPLDVAIDVKFAGICHSDIHQVLDQWGGSIFPMVPGHEIAGIVSAVGPDVTRYAVGDRVGVGCWIDSCGECENCLAGEENHCAKAMGTYNTRDRDGEVNHGGYSRHIVVTDRFVFRIPDSLPLDAAAPLLCAGITMYAPLKRYDVAGKKVAIVGMGGLGHVGVKIAAAMGAEVTVLSQTLSKRDDGLAYGATDYHATSDPATFKKLRSRFDVILNTVADNLDMDRYLGMLRIGGALVLLGIPENPDSYKAMSLLGMRRILTGSNTGGVPDTQDMLDFCGEHGIVAEIELVSADEADAAYERVVTSRARYRCVIDTATI